MRRSWTLSASLILLVVCASAASAQTPDSTIPPPSVTLSLEQALSEARTSSPEYRQFLNNAGPAKWALRNAYGNLLPGADVSGGFGYTGTGQANLGQGFTQQTSAFVQSYWQGRLTYQLDGGRLIAPSQQKANLKATDEEIDNEGVLLRYNITNQYLIAAASAAQVAVSRQQVERNQSFLELAQARFKVGQGTLIEVRQAEVQKGTADVQLLRDQQAENEAKLELFRQMGVVPPVDVQLIALSDSFPVTEPVFQLDDLLKMAEEENPALRALRYRADAASAGVGMARSAFFPSLFASAIWGGFTNQQTDEALLLQQATFGAQGQAQGCVFEDSVRSALSFPGVIGSAACFQRAGLNSTGTALTPAAQGRIKDANGTFPWHFIKNPFNLSVGVSLPIFTGFGRSLQVSQAQEFEDDADENVRAAALRIRTEVNTRYLALNASYKAIGVQAQSRDAARDQLRLAQDRYRLGSGSSLEVTDAQNAVQRAEGDYIAATYAYHRAVAILEAAVGRPLR